MNQYFDSVDIKCVYVNNATLYLKNVNWKGQQIAVIHYIDMKRIVKS